LSTEETQDLPHLKENVSEFFPHLYERVECPDFRRYAHGVEVIRFERGGLPRFAEA